jgi:hypothetical protein
MSLYKSSCHGYNVINLWTAIGMVKHAVVLILIVLLLTGAMTAISSLS